MDSVYAQRGCVRGANREEIEWNREIIRCLKKITSYIKNMKIGDVFNLMTELTFCIIELRETDKDSILDVDLLFIGLNLTKNLIDSKVIIEKCFKIEYATQELLKDLETIYSFFDDYHSMLKFGKLVPSRYNNDVIIRFEGSRSLMIYHFDDLLWFDQDLYEELIEDGEVPVLSGVLKLDEDPLASDFFKHFNSIIFC
nr:p23 [Lettuce chlorosis virus]